MAAKKKSGYDAQDIAVLEGLAAVRKRPGMYIGGTGQAGFQHLLWETLDNAVDEAAAGHADKITVVLHGDGSAEVSDNGRGIPIDEHPSRPGVSALEVVFTDLHAGGKFGGSAYESSGGLHGVGASVVNALSSKMIVEVVRERRRWTLGFKDGQAGQWSPKGATFKAGHDLGSVAAAGKAPGTTVRFWPDTEVFEQGCAWDVEALLERCWQVCCLVEGLSVVVDDKRPATKAKHRLKAAGGLEDMARQMLPGKPLAGPIRAPVVGEFTEKVADKEGTTEKTRQVDGELLLWWCDSSETQPVRSFVNIVPTPDGGTHVSGLMRAVTRAVNDLLLGGAKKLAKLAKDGNARVSQANVVEGLVGLLRVGFPEPQFKGQTKQELGTPAVEPIVYAAAKQAMTDWVESSGKKTHVTALRNKMVDALLAHAAAKEALEHARSQSKADYGAKSAALLPSKLADCLEHGPASELLLVEGDSAAGPAKAGRDSRIQAVLPLRGKVVNAAKSSTKQVLANAEAEAIIKSFGAGSGAAFNIDKARYGRIVILCDADVDGSHIRCLLLTLIYHHMRPLLEQGHVYAALPPLYSAQVGGETYRAWSDEQRDELVAKLCKGNRRKPESIRWVRFKGLGEMDTEELAECALDPATRSLKRLTLPDAKKAEKMFDTLMGTDVAQRRDYIIEQSDGMVDRESLSV